MPKSPRVAANCGVGTADGIGGYPLRLNLPRYCPACPVSSRGAAIVVSKFVAHVAPGRRLLDGRIPRTMLKLL